MAEEAPGIQNKKMLFSSALLGILVLVVYNIHIAQVYRYRAGKVIRLCKAARDLHPGDKITRQDIIIEEVPAQYTRALGKVIQAKDIDFLTAHREGLNKDVPQNAWFQWSDLTGASEEDSLEEMRKDTVGLTVQIDPAESPGDILRPGYRVNIVGVLAAGSRPPQAYRILGAVRVLAVAGMGAQEDVARRRPGADGQRSPRSYRSVAIEVHSSVSPALKNVLSYVQGDIWLEVCHPEARPEGNKPYSQVNPQLASLTTQSRIPEE